MLHQERLVLPLRSRQTTGKLILMALNLLLLNIPEVEALALTILQLEWGILKEEILRITSTP